MDLSDANLRRLAELLAGVETGLAAIVCGSGRGRIAVEIDVCQHTMRRPELDVRVILSGDRGDRTVRELQPFPATESVAAALARVRTGR